MYTSLSSARPHKTLYRFPCKRIVSQVTKKTHTRNEALESKLDENNQTSINFKNWQRI